MAEISHGDLQTIITNPDGAMMLVQRANKLGEELAMKKLSTSQIRSIFDEVRQIQAQWKMGSDQQQIAWRRLVLLKPKMAYRAKKNDKGVPELVAVLDPALDEVLRGKDRDQQLAHFQRFVDFFEAILAYHRYYGGK